MVARKKVEQVAMESTGVFWKCVWNIIEDERYEIKLWIVNPFLDNFYKDTFLYSIGVK